MLPPPVSGTGYTLDAADACFHAGVAVTGGFLDARFVGIDFVEGAVFGWSHVGHEHIGAA